MTTPESKDLIKKVFDLGLAAFFKMHGFKVVGANDKGFSFLCEIESDWNRLIKLETDYFNSEFVSFDGMIMELKRMPEIRTRPDASLHIIRSVGQAAYMQIKRNKMMAGKKSDNAVAPWSVIAHYIGENKESFWGYEVGPEDVDLFVETLSSWPNSSLREFNQQILQLKMFKRQSLGHRPKP